MTKNKITRPILRYPGGKYRIAQKICSVFPPHKMYVEPYAGAASVFFQKKKSKAEVLNDLNQEVVNVFSVLRSPVMAEELERLLKLSPIARADYERTNDPTDDPIEKARRFIWQSFATFGSDGVFRKKSGFRAIKNREAGIHNGNEWANYPAMISKFTERLQGVILECKPAIEIIKLYDTKHTLFYVDPPYLKESRARTRDIYPFEMDEQDHIELGKVLKHIKGDVVLSAYNSELYDQIYHGWNKIEITARAQGNTPRTEVLWLSPKTKPIQKEMWT